MLFTRKSDPDFNSKLHSLHYISISHVAYKIQFGIIRLTKTKNYVHNLTAFFRVIFHSLLFLSHTILLCAKEIKEQSRGVCVCVRACVCMHVKHSVGNSHFLATDWTARVRSRVLEGWRFFITTCPDWAWKPFSLP